MRILILAFLFISAIPSVIAQKANFNSTFVLQDGIYVSYKEILNNAPSFPNGIINVDDKKANIILSELNYSVAGNESALIKYPASQLFAMVRDGKLFIYYQKKLIPVYLKGTLCRFIYTREVSIGSTTNNSRSSEFKSDICVIDIQTGDIYMLTKENLAKSIRRDASLYATYQKTKPGKKNKNLFTYITDFNAKNPTSIPVTEHPSIVEE